MALAILFAWKARSSFFHIFALSVDYSEHLQITDYLAYAVEQINSLFACLVLAATILYGFSYNILSLTPTLNGFNFPTGYNRTIIHLQLFNVRLTHIFPSMFLANQTSRFVLWIIIFAGLSCTLLLSKRVKRWPFVPHDHH